MMSFKRNSMWVISSLAMLGFAGLPMECAGQTQSPDSAGSGWSSVASPAVADERLESQELDRLLAPEMTAEMSSRSIMPVSKAVDLNIRFVRGAGTLTPDSRRTLTRLAGAMKRLGPHGVRFTIEGYAGSTGKTSASHSLARKRALSVKRFLLDQGVSPKLITQTRGGVIKASNATENDDLASRRVRIISHLART